MKYIEGIFFAFFSKQVKNGCFKAQILGLLHTDWKKANAQDSIANIMHKIQQINMQLPMKFQKKMQKKPNQIQIIIEV